MGKSKINKYKYLLVQHTNKYWRGSEAFYLCNNEELAIKLKEIAKEQGVKIENTDDPIKDIANAVKVFDYLHLFELENETKTYSAKIVNMLFK